MKYYGLVDIENLSYGFVEENDENITDKFIEITDEYHQQLIDGQGPELQIVSDNETVFLAKPNLYFVNAQGLWEKKSEEEFGTEQAEIKRKELVQLVYDIKAKKAYGGVIINDLLVFETNQISITSTVASLALMSETSTANWKFYTVDGQPYSQEITKAQLFGIASFGQAMINACFAVEGQFNEKLKEATIEQLNDVEWCEKFVGQVQGAMDEINNKMTVGFQPTEIIPDEVVDNPDEVV